MINLEKKTFVGRRNNAQHFCFQKKKKERVILRTFASHRVLKFDRCRWGLCQREGLVAFFFCPSYANFSNTLRVCSLKMEILEGKFFGAAIHGFYFIILQLQL